MATSGFFSFHVHATREVAVPALNLLLDRGTNAFTVNLPPESIEDFKAYLTAEGARVILVNRLDGEDAFHGAPLLIETPIAGDSAESHLLLRAGAETDPHRSSSG